MLRLLLLPLLWAVTCADLRAQPVLAPGVQYECGGGNLSLVLDDFNADGVTDVVVDNDYTFSLLPNIGQGVLGLFLESLVPQKPLGQTRLPRKILVRFGALGLVELLVAENQLLDFLWCPAFHRSTSCFTAEDETFIHKTSAAGRELHPRFRVFRVFRTRTSRRRTGALRSARDGSTNVPC